MCRKLIPLICFVSVLGLVLPAVSNAGTKASSPDPCDGEKYAFSDVIVSWVAGDDASVTNGHDVYFGTSYSAVDGATTSSDEYMGRQSDNIFDTNDYIFGGLTEGDTYYWRIDEVNDTNTWKGDVWSFTVEVFVNVKTDLVDRGIHSSNAAGDGTTDDTDALQAAMEWVDHNVPYGGVVYCPAGTYRFVYIEPCNDVEVRGAGTSQTIFRPTETSGGAKLIRLRGGKIRDFTAYGTKPSQSGDNWQVDVGGPSHVIIARGIWNGAVIDNVIALEGKYDPLYMRGSQGLRVTNSEFDRAGRACVSIDALDGYDKEFFFGWCKFGPLRDQYLFNMEPSTGEGDYMSDGIFLCNDFLGEASGAYGTGTNYWGCFLSFKGTDSSPYLCHNIAVLGCDFDGAHVWVNKVFVNLYFQDNSMDTQSSYACFEQDYTPHEFAPGKIRGNTFYDVSNWSDVKDDVTFSGDSFFQCNDPSWANDEDCNWPDCNSCNESLLASTSDISELTHEQMWDLAKNCPLEWIAWYADHHWELGKANRPGPVNQQTSVSTTADLSWTAGYRATSHDVYFGTSYSAVSDANDPNTSPGQGNQTETTFDPGTMDGETTYYWRIDERCTGGIKAGTIWSFTTETAGAPPGQATNPSPVDSANDVSINADLSWTAGSGATSHDVYFGTSSPPASQGNQAETTYDPGTMDKDTTYYWRIDEKNAGGTTTGIEWSFTTETFVDCVADSDIAVSGTVSGSYTDTQTSNDGYESIEEVESGGNPAKRYSYLEHKWTIDVISGNTITFYVEAYHTSNTENDDFVFAYSMSEEGSYTNMVTVTKTSDDDTYQSYELPSSTSGTIYIRVKDTDQSQGNKSLDTIYIDHMYIESAGNPTPGVTITESDGSTDVDEEGPTSDTYTVVLDTLPTDTVTITVDPDIETEVNSNGAGNSIQLTFTTSDWDTPQTVTVTAIDDIDEEGAHTSTITHSASSNDNDYDGISIDDVVANVTDNDGACNPVDCHVESIVCETVNVGGGNKKGQATVTIYDNCSSPVPYADVDGTFTGDYEETFYDVTTDVNGVAVFLTTGTQKGGVSFTFCVDDVDHATLPYDANDNVETCDTN